MAVQSRVGFGIRRTAGEVKRYRVWMKTVPIALAIAALILIVGYVLSVLYMKFGAFTVKVNKFDNLDYALTLSETPDLTVHTSRLTAEISEEITNIDGETLPTWLDNYDGVHNGENYVAYTFYCHNAGIKTVSYTYDLYIANMTQETEKAVRVRMYVDGVPTTYAYPRTDGIEGPEPGTVAFQGRGEGATIVRKVVEHFKPGDMTKFTIVIWLEGPDPDCVDKIIGGKFKIDMAIEILHEEVEEDEQDA